MVHSLPQSYIQLSNQNLFTFRLKNFLLEFFLSEMQYGTRKFTEWLAKLPEKEYLRMVYVGKLQIPSSGSGDCEKDNSVIELEELMNKIWKAVSMKYKLLGISGHISYTNQFHVCQLIEGKLEHVRNLMAEIRNDPRIIIYKEFSKSLSTLNHGWYIAMCYTIQVVRNFFWYRGDGEISLWEMFDSLENTYNVRLQGLRITEFYRKAADMLLLKYMSIIAKEKF